MGFTFNFSFLLGPGPQPRGQHCLCSGWVFLPQINLSGNTIIDIPEVCLLGDSNPSNWRGRLSITNPVFCYYIVKSKVLILTLSLPKPIISHFSPLPVLVPSTNQLLPFIPLAFVIGLAYLKSFCMDIHNLQTLLHGNLETWNQRVLMPLGGPGDT